MTTWGEVIGHHVPQLACTVFLVLGATIACIVTPSTSTQADVTYSGGSVVPEGAFDNSGSSDIDQYANMSVREYFEKKLGDNPCIPNLGTSTLEALSNTDGYTPEEKAHNTDFLLIGDSVTASFVSSEYGDFKGMFPNAILDSQVNRTISQGEEILKGYLEKGWNGPVVIFELGTNSVPTKAAMDSLLKTVPEGKMVFLVNVRAKSDHVDSTNAMLTDVASQHGNVEVIDWYAISAGHDNFFDGDGTHLSAANGAPAYQQMLLANLETLY